MEWKDLAPWIAIAITLSLSILVPLFTQIANNRHQRKLQCEAREYENKKKKAVVYEEFLLNVGAAIMNPSPNALEKAGASVQQMYIFAPIEWQEQLDNLSDYLRKYEWGNASKIMKQFSRRVSEEQKKK